MVFVADTSDFEEIAGLLKSTHLYQSGFGGTSALMGILPESMISYLLSSSPSEFSQDFITILQEDVSSEWKFSHMAPVTFEELNEEVWCGGVYLGKFCAKEDFVVKDPLEFMGELARKWRAEVGRKKAAFDMVQAATYLGLDPNTIRDSLPLIREGFRQKAMELEASA
uniref:Uncharacterized protein n=1 Tax=Globisporangium ultimum (strain ATCC 200006 / CBS 805.95 / DAOM BR144) TaxID=431595 RepID=K3W7T6_GLOUD